MLKVSTGVLLEPSLEGSCRSTPKLTDHSEVRSIAGKVSPQAIYDRHCSFYISIICMHIPYTLRVVAQTYADIFVNSFSIRRRHVYIAQTVVSWVLGSYSSFFQPWRYFTLINSNVQWLQPEGDKASLGQGFRSGKLAQGSVHAGQWAMSRTLIHLHLHTS